jgi:hypothetical protein
MAIDIAGVDFSGAAEPAGGLWITVAEAGDGKLTVTEQFDGSRWGTERRAIHRGLREFVGEEPFDIVGMDFPFGLPKALFADDNGIDDWQGVLEWVEGTEPDANAFRAACGDRGREATDGERAQLRRETDWRRGALCPYNIQIQYQTFFGLRNVLGPLADGNGATIVPQQGTPGGKTAVVEVYPAATFGRLGLYREGYKGESGAATARRKTNVQGLTDTGIELDREQFDRYVADADALDSLAATHAAWTALSETRRGGHSETRAFEGFIFCNAEP